jgi:hypothetical protein
VLTGWAPGTIIERVMTAKEQLLLEALGWSEHDAEIALRAVQREHAGGNGDEWGELSQVHEVGETMKRLAEEERAAGHKPW